MDTNSEILEKFRLDGRVGLVTGGAGLLGRQFAGTLAQAGAAVIVADIDDHAAAEVAGSLAGQGCQAAAVAVDLADADSVRSLIDTGLARFGRLDILVNSAALDPKFDPGHADQHGTGFEDFPLDAWNQALAVNLTGMFLVTQAAVSHLLQHGHGSIINICSTYGLVGPDQRIYEMPGQPTRRKPAYYTVTKAGVLGFTRYLATYYAGQPLRVNALTPGGVFNDHDSQFVENYAARTVLGRMARQDEMNGALLFLASDASSYMTGANLVVDGGWTAW